MAKQAMISRRAPPTQKLLVKEKASNVLVLENPNTSVVKSIQFMKQLTVVAVSSIAYLRGLFPSEAFRERKLGGQPVFCLTANSEIPDAMTFQAWITKAFELVQSHHLQKMLLVIKKDLDTMEVYKFSFSYNHEAIHYDVLGEIDGEEVVLKQSQGLPEDIAKSVSQLVRSILVHATTLAPLPDDCGVSLKLFVDETTPEDVVPDMFQPDEDNIFNFPAEAETLKLGKVETKFSTFAVSSKAVFNREQDVNETVHEETVVISEDEDEEGEIVPGSQESFKMTSLGSSTSLSMLSNNLTVNNVPEIDSNTTNLSEKISLVSLKEKTINCICECSDLQDDTIKCAHCSTFQHKACYKILESQQPESHVCVNCHNPSEGMSCSVPELLHDQEKKESAVYRQALMYCCKSSQVSCKRLMTNLMLPRRMAEKIFHKLDSDGCFEPAVNKGFVRTVRPDFKENVLGRYFNATETSPMEVPDSPSILRSQETNRKRIRSEEKENNLPGKGFPQPKQRKILTTAKKLKKSSL